MAHSKISEDDVLDVEQSAEQVDVDDGTTPIENQGPLAAVDVDPLETTEWIDSLR
jgi:hypothetical protein